MRRLLLCIGAALAAVCLVQTAHAYEWRTENILANALGSTAIAVDKQNTPHIVYSEPYRTAYHTYRTGSSWTAEAVPTYPAYSPSLAVDQAGGVHLAAYDDNANRFQYLYGRNGTWDATSLSNERTYIYYDGVSLGLDATGKPYIAYQYYTNPGEQYRVSRVVCHDSTRGWVEQGTREHFDPRSLVVDDQGLCYLGHEDTARSTLSYSFGNERTPWQSEVVDGNVIAHDISIGLQRNGKPEICYSETRSYTLRYAFWNGSSWTTRTLDSVSTTYAGVPSMRMDSHGNAHIAYLGTGNALKYAHWNGSSWIIDTIDTSSCFEPSLALDSFGNPHISYAGDFLGGRGTVRYAYAAVPEPSSLLILLGGIGSIGGMVRRGRR